MIAPRTTALVRVRGLRTLHDAVALLASRSSPSSPLVPADTPTSRVFFQ